MARILLAEDDELNRDLICSVLSLAGHDVVEARDGLEALELFRTGPPDLIITDLVMPRMGGLAFIQELKLHHPVPKILALAGTGDLVLDEAAKAGADRLLGKPFHIQDLQDTVAQMLSCSPSDP